MQNEATVQPEHARFADMSPRTRLILTGPIVPTLLGLAAPTVLVMVVQALMSAVDAFFLGWLGSDALAGVALVFPLVMLTITMSGGGLGGGISSAVARALGGGRRAEADAIAVHSLLLGGVFAALFTVGPLLGGRALYTLMGGEGAALEAALTYSNVVFLGASGTWLLNVLASILRGSGQMVVPSVVVILGELVHVALAPLLIFGWGPVPALGIQGAGIALVATVALRAAVLAAYVASGRSLVRPRLRGRGLEWRHFADILRVGAPGAANTLLTNVNVMLLTGLAGTFGTAALAGYGLGARLEYLLIPLVFGMGAALVTMVGTNVGAGLAERAERVAWVGAGLAGAVTGTIGLAAALAPWAWMGVFTADPEVVAAGTTYLQIAGPSYAFFGLGLALYFASQGAGRLLWPLAAGAVRLVVAAGGGWIAITWLGGGPTALYAAIAVGIVTYGSMVSLSLYFGAWRRAGPRAVRRGRAASLPAGADVPATESAA